ncbi:hypothetical protein KO361_04245 [Candidatus Woesearchaeota archaeon]|nr:hypothetical protein [Candidatus Woesearchaeota archaeon]
MVFGFLNLAKEEHIEQAKKELYSNLPQNHEEWDPTGKSPVVSLIKEKNVKNHAKYLFLKNNPGYVKKTFLKIIGIIILAFTISRLLSHYTQTSFFIMNTLIIIGSFILLIVFHFKVQSIRRDLIKLEVAKENNYLYWPDKNHKLWRDYAHKYTEVFNRGDQDQNLEDIFWGTTNINGKKHNFTSGLFNYTRVSRDNKGNTKHQKFTDHYFIIKLPRRLESRFYLYPEGVISKIANFFTNKKIKTESIKFNDTFAFSYKGKKTDKHMNITQILTPRVQEELVKISDYKKKGNGFFTRRSTNGLSVLFAENAVVFYAPGRILRKTKMNFFKSSDIKEEDKNELKKELETMIKVSDEIINYLD